jgi:hypothetical protein
MSRRIVVEALVVVVTLRIDELRGRLTGRLPRGVRRIRDDSADTPNGQILDAPSGGPAAVEGPSAGKGG